jgi:hypothetical protein
MLDDLVIIVQLFQYTDEYDTTNKPPNAFRHVNYCCSKRLHFCCVLCSLLSLGDKVFKYSSIML